MVTERHSIRRNQWSVAVIVAVVTAETRRRGAGWLWLRRWIECYSNARWSLLGPSDAAGSAAILNRFRSLQVPSSKVGPQLDPYGIPPRLQCPHSLAHPHAPPDPTPHGTHHLHAHGIALRTQVLFMGERGCWPDWDMGPGGRHFCTDTYPSSPTPYRCAHLHPPTAPAH